MSQLLCVRGLVPQIPERQLLTLQKRLRRVQLRSDRQSRWLGVDEWRRRSLGRVQLELLHEECVAAFAHPGRERSHSG